MRANRVGQRRLTQPKTGCFRRTSLRCYRRQSPNEIFEPLVDTEFSPVFMGYFYESNIDLHLRDSAIRKCRRRRQQDTSQKGKDKSRAEKLSRSGVHAGFLTVVNPQAALPNPCFSPIS